MKRLILLAALWAFLLTPLQESWAKGGMVYVIPVEGMIERALVYAIRRGVEEAKLNRAQAIVLDMNTPGGRLDSAEEIISIITDTDIPTITFVNPNAISAGAIIAMATDTIYMAPGGRIGDAMPIMMSPLPLGEPKALPEGLKEKALSPTEALIRSAAQRKGHDPKLAAAMVRPEHEYKIGDNVICAKGELLTLTAQEAAQPGVDGKPILSSGTVKDIAGILKAIDRAEARVVTVRIIPTERVARFIESFPVSGLLLALGLLALYIEFKTPGFGLPGTAGILLLAVWFWGHHIAGLAGLTEIILFALGVGLVLVEIFLIPGFGFVGATGTSLILVSLLMATVQHYPSQPWYRPPEWQFMAAARNLGLTMLTTGALVAIAARFLPNTRFFRELSLETSVGKAEGYQATPAGTLEVLGLHGTAVTPLRPGGTGTFGEQRLSVVTRGEFLDSGAPIVVAEAHGNRIVVEAAGVPGKPSRQDKRA